MKKWFALFLSVLMLATLAMPASAAVTGTYTDEIVDGFAPEVVDYSNYYVNDNELHRINYEYNTDLERTLLGKTAAPRTSSHTEYIVYEMAKPIAGFEMSVMCCAGLGDPLTDISVFVGNSKEGPWSEISTQATLYEIAKYPGTDEDIYISWDTTYWFESTLMNKAKIPAGNKYLKIQLNPCTDKNDVPWNVMIDNVKITMGANEPAPTIPAAKKFKTWEKIAAEQKATATTNNGGNTNNTTANNNSGNTNNTTANNNSGNTNTTTVNNNSGNTNNTTVNNNGGVVGDTTTNVGGTVDTTTNVDGTVDTTTNAEGGVDANTTTAADGSSAPAEDTNDKTDDNKDTSTDGSAQKKGGAWIWIVGGVVVLAAAAVIVLVVLKKKA